MALSFLLWLPFLLIPLLLLLNKNKSPKKHYPPSPPKLPIIGNLHQFTQSGSSVHQNLWQLSKKYGPIMLLHLGRIPTLVISSAEAAKQVMKDNDLKSCSRPSSTGSRKLTYNYQDMAFAPYGEYWREIRKICVHEIFSVKRVQSYRAIREEEVAKMIASISNESAFSSSSSVDVTAKLFSLMGSLTLRVIFGTSFEGSSFEHDKFHQVLHEAEIMFTGFTAADFFPSKIGSLIDWISGKHSQFEKVSRELDGFFQQVIDDHLKPGRLQQEQEDIIDVLLKIVKEKTSIGAAQLGHENIKGLLLNLFLGGIDTGAIAMVWAMAELAKKPMLMKKAQDEVRSIVGNKGKVSEIDTEQLPYLKMIIKESLRLHPPAPLIPRETLAPFEVLGYDVEPKTLVMVNDWAISRDPKYWPHPEEFIPERFEDSSMDFRGQHFEFLPFGAGRRICPGIYMATTTLELALANLLYSFDWKLPEGMTEDDVNMEETTGELALTVSKKTPLNLVPLKIYG